MEVCIPDKLEARKVKAKYSGRPTARYKYFLIPHISRRISA